MPFMIPMVNSPWNRTYGPGKQLPCLVRSKDAKDGDRARSLIPSCQIEKSSLSGQESRCRTGAFPKAEEVLVI